jgi:DNA-binding response OmpR family regulator
MEVPKRQREIRILVADDDLIPREAVMEFLTSHGFDVKAARNGAEAKDAVANWLPHFVLFDLMLTDLNALTFLKWAQSGGLLGENKIRVFVMSGHNNPSNVKDCLKAGASDFLAKPLNHGELLARLVVHLQEKRKIREFTQRQDADYDAAQYIVHLTDLILREGSKGAPVEDTLHNATKMVAMALKAVRVSVIKCDAESRRGLVLASSDKRDIGALALELGKYPEVMYVLRTNVLLALDNLATDPTMHFVTRQDKQISFNSMVVAPIHIGSDVWGVLSVRMPESRQHLKEHEIRFAQLVAHVAGLILLRDPALAAPLAVQFGAPENGAA